MKQEIISGPGCYADILDVLARYGMAKPLLVIKGDYIAPPATPHLRFSAFTENPKHEDVLGGVALFKESGCDGILAIGGGSAMDTAKGIKLFAGDLSVKLIAVPTTAGTGSESTRYAVIYKNGEKQSVTHDGIVPNCAILDAELLYTLPLYQKKCTALDALCQAIEALWSVNATEQSDEIALKSVRMMMLNLAPYLENINDLAAAQAVMQAANLSGQALNVTQTTAPHAMSYKLTSLYKLPHGHAVAICLPKVWRYMAENSALRFPKIAGALGYPDDFSAIDGFEKMLADMQIEAPALSCEAELLTLVSSVNKDRLQNNPLCLSQEAIETIYRSVLLGGDRL